MSAPDALVVRGCIETWIKSNGNTLGHSPPPQNKNKYTYLSNSGRWFYKDSRGASQLCNWSIALLTNSGYGCFVLATATTAAEVASNLALKPAPVFWHRQGDNGTPRKAQYSELPAGECRANLRTYTSIPVRGWEHGAHISVEYFSWVC